MKIKFAQTFPSQTNSYLDSDEIFIGSRVWRTFHFSLSLAHTSEDF